MLFLLQLWFYEYFPGLAPRRRRGVVHDFPVGASWRDRGESRVESISSLLGLLRRGTSTISVRVDFTVNFFTLVLFFRHSLHSLMVFRSLSRSSIGPGMT